MNSSLRGKKKKNNNQEKLFKKKKTHIHKNPKIPACFGFLLKSGHKTVCHQVGTKCFSLIPASHPPLVYQESTTGEDQEV
jgi:hypothetical protein